MTISRITQNMMMNRSYLSLQTGLSRLAKTQEHLTTGRVLNRPSDSPTDTTAAMRLRAGIADHEQYSRNAENGVGWLNQTDSTLSSMATQIRRARELALQGANAGAMSPESRAALAVEVDQLREGLLASANTTYLDRPLFGGVTASALAYDSNGVFQGVRGDVNRTIGKDIRVSVNINGEDVFGVGGASLFQDLSNLSLALRDGSDVGIETGITALGAGLERVTAGLAEVGARTTRIERALQASKDMTLQLSASLSDIENTDLARATMDLKLQEVAYQAALASTARLVQPSLSDFLR